MQLYALASMTSWVYSIVWTPQSADRQPGARYFKVKSHQPPKKCISNYHIGNIKGFKTYFDIGQIKIFWGDKENKILSWSYWYCATSSLYISILWPTYKCKTTEFASCRDMKWIVTKTFDWPKQRTFENWGNSNHWRRRKDYHGNDDDNDEDRDDDDDEEEDNKDQDDEDGVAGGWMGVCKPQVEPQLNRNITNGNHRHRHLHQRCILSRWLNKIRKSRDGPGAVRPPRSRRRRSWRRRRWATSNFQLLSLMASFCSWALTIRPLQ